MELNLTLDSLPHKTPPWEAALHKVVHIRFKFLWRTQPQMFEGLPNLYQGENREKLSLGWRVLQNQRFGGKPPITAVGLMLGRFDREIEEAYLHALQAKYHYINLKNWN